MSTGVNFNTPAKLGKGKKCQLGRRQLIKSGGHTPAGMTHTISEAALSIEFRTAIIEQIIKSNF
ncbi:MAG: hypothetical protein FWE67_13720 [Planctomycetaceae bacterium]|nr:hypothetical protein [Planctomycetaceae bacterium]